MIIQMIWILFLAFAQNVSFSIVSRSRNRDNMKYHLVAATFSNSLWFFTMRELVLADLNIWLLVPYLIGTVFGSVSGAKISMKIEKYLGASTDNHLKK